MCPTAFFKQVSVLACEQVRFLVSSDNFSLTSFKTGGLALQRFFSMIFQKRIQIGCKTNDYNIHGYIYHNIHVQYIYIYTYRSYIIHTVYCIQYVYDTYIYINDIYNIYRTHIFLHIHIVCIHTHTLYYIMAHTQCIPIPTSLSLRRQWWC